MKKKAIASATIFLSLIVGTAFGADNVNLDAATFRGTLPEISDLVFRGSGNDIRLTANSTLSVSIPEGALGEETVTTEYRLKDAAKKTPYLNLPYSNDKAENLREDK